MATTVSKQSTAISEDTQRKAQIARHLTHNYRYSGLSYQSHFYRFGVNLHSTMATALNLGYAEPRESVNLGGGKTTWFVPKVSVLIFLCTNWQRSTSLMYIGTLVVTLAACPYLYQLDWFSKSCATAVCVWSCFLTSLRLRCRKISNEGTLSNFV